VSSQPAQEGVRIRAVAPEDVPALMTLVLELAEYERLADEVHSTEALFERALFGERPSADALIAEHDGQLAGYALFYPTFSSFLAIQGIWLEDIYVRPAHRKAGIGRALLASVAAGLRKGGGERLEWAALDWNELALDFYRGLGARGMSEWITHRLIGEDLARLAAEAPELG
jgi:GNAT superfamily N-acetyltransferase